MTDGRTWSSPNLFLSNDINKNGRDGLDLKGGDFNRLLFNRIDENKIAGIEVGGDASGNVIDDNRLTLSRANGIRLSGLSTANTLHANKLKKNRSTDIHAEPPANVNNTLDLNE